MATSEQEFEQSESSVRRWALADLAPFLITLVAGAICYGLFYRRGLGLAVIGYSIAPTERVLQGEVPYRDFLFNYTPGLLWLNALLMKAMGVSLLTVRTGLFVIKLLTLVMIFQLARRLTNGRAALLPVALTLAWLGYEHLFNPYPDIYFMPFALAGIFCALHYDQSERLRWLFLGGLAAGLVFLFKHNVGVFVFGCAIIALALREWTVGAYATRAELLRGIIKRGAVYLAGFAVIAIAMAAYLYSQHALGAMVEHFRHHAAAYSESRSISLPPVKELLPLILAMMIDTVGAIIVIKYAPRLFIAFVTVAALFIATVVLWSNRAYLFKESATAAVAYLPLMLFVAVIVAALWNRQTLQSVAKRLTPREAAETIRQLIVFVMAALTAIWPGRKARAARATLKEHAKAVWQSVVVQFQSRELRRDWWQRNGVTITVMLFTVGVYLEMFPRADYYHLVRILPPVFVLLQVVLWRLRPVIEDGLRSRLLAPSRTAWALVFVVMALLVVIGWQATWRPQFDGHMRFVDRNELAIERGYGILVGRQQATLVDGLVKLIQDNSTADDTIFSFSQRASALYFLADRRNPTRFLWWRSVGISKDERDAVMQMISDRKPKLVIVQEIAATQKMRDYVGIYYHRLGAVADLAVYARNEQADGV